VGKITDNKLISSLKAIKDKIISEFMFLFHDGHITDIDWKINIPYMNIVIDCIDSILYLKEKDLFFQSASISRQLFESCIIYYSYSYLSKDISDEIYKFASNEHNMELKNYHVQRTEGKKPIKKFLTLSFLIKELDKIDLIKSLENKYRIFKDLEGFYKTCCDYLHMKPSYISLNESFSKLDHIKNPEGSLTFSNVRIVGYLRTSDDGKWNALLSFVEDCGNIMLRGLTKQSIIRYPEKHKLIPF
jgi:hypothetical protein